MHPAIDLLACSIRYFAPCNSIVCFVWLVGRDYRVEGRWVLKDLRYRCIDLWVCPHGRVIFRDSAFFDFRLYSEDADKGGL